MRILEAVIRMRFQVPNDFSEELYPLIKIGLRNTINEVLGHDQYRVVHIVDLKEVKE